VSEPGANYTDETAAAVRGTQDEPNEMAEDDSDGCFIDEPYGESLNEDD